MKEMWKDIAGYEGKYQISSLGKVKIFNYKNTKNVRIMKDFIDGRGYIRACLCKNGIGKFYSVHRLVAEAFIPNPENKITVNHKDGNKLNNKVDNLEWNTYAENNIHAIVNNLRPRKLGKDNLTSKIIYQIDIETDKILNIFYGTGDIKRKMNYKDTSAISKCCRNIKNYKTAYGYKWRYAKGGEK